MKKLSAHELLLLVEEWEKFKQDARFAADEAKIISERIIAEFDRRGIQSLGIEGVNITKVSAERLVYDEMGLWRDLPVKERRECFSELVDLSKLSRVVRSAVIKVLPMTERKRARTIRLHVDKLSVMVQEGRVPAEIVKQNSKTKKNAPYISVSYGPGG